MLGSWKKLNLNGLSCVKDIILSPKIKSVNLINSPQILIQRNQFQARIRSVLPADFGSGLSFQLDNIGGKGVVTAHLNQ